MEVKNRSYSDNDTPEIAGKLLPLHPIDRYKSFSALWKQTRKMGGYVPRPSACAANEEDYFPCCLKCAQPPADRTRELLARRSAQASWLTAEWCWDFGFTLDEEWLFFGVGITAPNMPVERDRIFVLNPELKRGYLEISLQEHAKLKGKNLHEAKVKVYTNPGFASVSFPGEIAVSPTGSIWVAQPRSTFLGQGKAVFERFIFEPVQMPYALPVLVHGDDIIVASGKVSLRGIALN